MCECVCVRVLVRVRVQEVIDDVSLNALEAVRQNHGHCLEGALLGAYILGLHGSVACPPRTWPFKRLKAFELLRSESLVHVHCVLTLLLFQSRFPKRMVSLPERALSHVVFTRKRSSTGRREKYLHWPHSPAHPMPMLPRALNISAQIRISPYGPAIMCFGR